MSTTTIAAPLTNAELDQNYAYEHGVDKPEADQWTWPF